MIYSAKIAQIPENTILISTFYSAIFQLKINGSNFFETYLNQRRFAFKKSLDKLLNPVQRNRQVVVKLNKMYSQIGVNL